ncbi:retroviral-like aspartic protease family protein [Kaarinaea lacus]
MRKILELSVVFLLGWALAVYFLKDEKSENANPPMMPPESDRSAFASSTAESPEPSSHNIAILSPYAAELEKVKQQLQQGDINGVMVLLQQHRATPNDQLWQQYRRLFFQQLQQLKSNKQYHTAVDWLTLYLQTEYDDVMALQVLADFHYLEKNYLAAIDTLYLAKSYAHGSSKLDQIVTTQRAMSNEYVRLLQSQKDYLGLLDLYQRLISVEPEHSAHYIGLAETYWALGNEADARQALNVIAYDPEAGIKANQLLTLIDSQTSGGGEESIPINLTRHGNSLLTEVLFNNQTYGRLLVDTGASLTVITPQMLHQLSLSNHTPIRKGWFNTANGVVEAPIFLIQNMSVGGQAVDQLEIAVMDLNNDHINGLLGMNFLQHFRFSIDQQNNVLYLSPRH